MNFNAAVLTKIKKPLQLINNLKIPQLKRGQILVRILHSAICGSQIMEIEGKRGKDKYIPHLLLDFEWEHLEKIKKYKYEGRKIRGIQELMYVLCEYSSGSSLYMSPTDFVEQHNRENPYWEWNYDEVSKDVDFSPKDYER